MPEYKRPYRIEYAVPVEWARRVDAEKQLAALLRRLGYCGPALSATLRPRHATGSVYLGRRLLIRAH